MAKQIETAIFDDQGDLLVACRRSRENGYVLVDAYTPYPVHGIEEAMGLKHSFLGWVTFCLAMTGVAVALHMQIWTMAYDWPWIIGGKPFNSWPAFIPITFELGVLFSGVGTVVTMFAINKLYPGKEVKLPAPEVMDDHFALAVVAGDRSDKLQALLKDCGAKRIISSEA